MEGADLTGAIMRHANLTQAVLRDATLSFTNFRDADLSEAKLDHALAIGANFEGAILQATDLGGTDLGGASLYGVFLTNRTLLIDARWHGIHTRSLKWWQAPGEFERGRYAEAAAVCGILSDHFKSIGQHDLADNFYYAQMSARHLRAIGAIQGISFAAGWRARRRAFASGAFSWRRLWWYVHRSLWGYGIRPGLVVAWSLAALIVFAVIHGAARTGLHVGGVNWRAAREGLRASLLSFTALGSVVAPQHVAAGEVVSGIEATIGTILTSMFIVALAAKFIRR